MVRSIKEDRERRGATLRGAKEVFSFQWFQSFLSLDEGERRVRRMLGLLRSRWMMGGVMEWRNCTPLAMSRASISLVRHVIVTPEWMKSYRFPSSMYSITSAIGCSDTPRNPTIFGCDSPLISHTSRRNCWNTSVRAEEKRREEKRKEMFNEEK